MTEQILHVNATLRQHQIETRPLPEGWFRAGSGPTLNAVTVYCREGWLCVAYEVTRPVGRLGIKNERAPHVAIARRLEEIASIEIEGLTQDHAKGPSMVGALTFGVPGALYGANRRVAGMTGVLVTDKAGAWFLVEMQAPPLAVKATWSSVAQALADDVS